MKGRVIIDTGPIVGLIRSDDQWSSWSSDQAKPISAPYLTCEAVISEANFLLQGFHNGADILLKMVELDVLRVNFSLQNEAKSIRSLMKKYSNVPMSLADACLVRMSEIHDEALVFTVDSDSHIYRKHGRRKVPLISPF